MEPSRYACCHITFLLVGSTQLLSQTIITIVLFYIACILTIVSCISQCVVCLLPSPMQINSSSFQCSYWWGFDVHPFFLLNNQSRMHRCHPQELLRSFALPLGMSYSCIRLLCQFRFVCVQTLNDCFSLPHYAMPLYLSKSQDILVSVLFQALILFQSNWPLPIFFLKLEKQLDSISQVAAIVHNDFYHLSQEILGLAFQVCKYNFLLSIIMLYLGFGWFMLMCLWEFTLKTADLWQFLYSCIRLCHTVLVSSHWNQFCLWVWY
jgi:hypothetical protein